MKISYNWLKEYIDLKGVSAKKVADLLTLHSFEVESVEKKGDDWALDIDVLPNRGHDSRCHLAIAMELAAILNKKPKFSYQTLKTTALSIAKAKLMPVEVKIACPDKIVPRYAGLVIKNVRPGLSPKWLQERLKAIGLRTINNLVDLTNYIMYELGQPMHAFDYDKISSLYRIGIGSRKEAQMIVRLSKKGEKVMTLDKVERELNQGILIIESGGKLIDLAGIMGGALSEIGPKTKNIILQAACFGGTTIRRATKTLDHRTEASDIYQHNIDPNFADLALARAWYLLKQIAVGQIVQKIDFYPQKYTAPTINLDLTKVRSLLGVNLSEKKIIQILKALNFDVETHGHASLRVIPPTRRLDINIPEDLIEEIGRIYGYQNIKPVMPRVHLQPAEPNEAVIYKNQMRQILVNLGFDEVMNYIFTYFDVETHGHTSLQKKLVALQNPISQEKTHLRISLLPGLVQNLKDNLKNFSEMQIFEIGHVFNTVETGLVPVSHSRKKRDNHKGCLYKINEKENLAGVLLLPHEKELFFRAKGIIDVFLQSLGLHDIWYDDVLEKSETVDIGGNMFDQAVLAQIKVGEKIIGHLGQLEQKFADQVAAGFEFDLASLIQEITEERMYEPPSRYPALVRDLAVLVPPATKVAEVLNTIHSVDILELFDVDLFDMYEGETLAGRKNLAFRLVFQSRERTLNDRQVNKFMTRIMQAIEKQKGWTVRK